MTALLVGLTVAAYSGSLLCAVAGSTLAHAVGFCVLMGVGSGLSWILTDRVNP